MTTEQTVQWLAVVTPPLREGEPWRALVVRLAPHADGSAGHHWWPLTPSEPAGLVGVRRFDDEEGNTAAVELTADSLGDVYARLQAAGLDHMAVGSPTLLVDAEGNPGAGGWVWPLTSVGVSFPFAP